MTAKIQMTEEEYREFSKKIPKGKEPVHEPEKAVKEQKYSDTHPSRPLQNEIRYSGLEPYEYNMSPFSSEEVSALRGAIGEQIRSERKAKFEKVYSKLPEVKQYRKEEKEYQESKKKYESEKEKFEKTRKEKAEINLIKARARAEYEVRMLRLKKKPITRLWNPLGTTQLRRIVRARVPIQKVPETRPVSRPQVRDDIGFNIGSFDIGFNMGAPINPVGNMKSKKKRRDTDPKRDSRNQA